MEVFSVTLNFLVLLFPSFVFLIFSFSNLASDKSFSEREDKMSFVKTRRPTTSAEPGQRDRPP